MTAKMPQYKKDAIAHYKRMIKWAKTQPQRGEWPEYDVMSDNIHEDWYALHCSYCAKFMSHEDDVYNPCYLCPLSLFKEKSFPIDEGKICCNGLWAKINEAKTWSTWIKRAEKVLEYIKENG